MSLHILVINENEALCDFLSHLLSEDGHEVSCVRGYREALLAARSERPELIILEVSTTAIGAVETADRLHRAEESRHVPVIVISDYPELEFELLNLFDFILTPVDTARLREDIETIAQGGKKRSLPSQGEPLSEQDYLLYYEYLLGHSGLHFERRNLKILERGLFKRMSALKIDSYREYYDYLILHQERRQELKKLLPFLTIGETYFFRYHAHFAALRKLLLDELATMKPGEKIKLRLWSAGCSTGEEPYSMAMTVMETIPAWQDMDIKILATDIDNRALKRARDGIYGPWAMRVIEKRYLDRYFDKIGKGYRIKDEVKSLVDFSHLNLQTAEFPSSAGEFSGLDAIFCRNVIIYFTLATTREIIEKFSSCLKPAGYLFLGHSETLSHISSRFERQTHDGGFYYLKKVATTVAAPNEQPRSEPSKTTAAVIKPARPKPPLPVKIVPPRSTAPARSEIDISQLFRKALELFEEEHFPEAMQLLKEVIRHQPDHAGALITQGFILANDGHFQEALAACDRALDIDDLLAEAYFLKGLVLDMSDNLTEAAEEYRKAILLEMNFVMPHYQLSWLYARMGKDKERQRELNNTLNILAKLRENSTIPYSGGLSREAFIEQLKRELEMAG